MAPADSLRLGPEAGRAVRSWLGTNPLRPLRGHLPEGKGSGVLLLAVLALSLIASASAQTPAPPSWAEGAVWYQIFPERFRNGDPANDPTWASIEFNQYVDSTLWAPMDWTADWYARADWEEAKSPGDFYDSVFHRRYGGDLQGVMEKVDYLADLGVEVVYFNPVFHARSLHKYDASSFHHIDPFFGPDPEGDLALITTENPGDPTTWVWTSADSLFLNLVSAFHQRGVRVVIDGVFNHTGTDFWAFRDVRENQEASRFADWYEFTAWDDPVTPDSEFDWNGWWGYKALPVFANNADSTGLHPEVKAHVFEATRRWMDPDGDGDPSDGIDGWRLDVAEEVPAGFWRDWTAHVAEINPEAVTVAENWGDAAHYLEETGFTTVMAYSAFAIPVEAALMDRRWTLEAFADSLTTRQARYPETTRHALQTLTSSHDTDRLASMIINGDLGAGYDRKAGPRDTTAYQVRAPNAAERDLQRLIVALQMTSRGAPMLYYGDEAGMWGADDPDDRKPFPWPDLAMETESRDPLGRPRTPDPIAFDSTFHAFHRDAIALRKRWDVLRRGDQQFLHASDEAGTLAFERTLGDTRLVIAFNRSDDGRFVQLPGESGPLVPIFASRGTIEDIPAQVHLMDDGGLAASGYPVPARTLVVYRPVTDEDIRPKGLDE
ncbi:MAG: glycoside hydrolase family 13 protein [Bacteroidota bacterium]